jgi:hypothetical protein
VRIVRFHNGREAAVPTSWDERLPRRRPERGAAETHMRARATELSKRSSNFQRIDNDAYYTPTKVVAPLLPLLAPHTRFIEPCVGDGRLADCMAAAGHVLVGAYDLPTNARSTRYSIPDGAIFITNPPHSRDLLHPIIVNLSDQALA